MIPVHRASIIVATAPNRRVLDPRPSVPATVRRTQPRAAVIVSPVTFGARPKCIDWTTGTGVFPFSSATRPDCPRSSWARASLCKRKTGSAGPPPSRRCWTGAVTRSSSPTPGDQRAREPQGRGRARHGMAPRTLLEGVLAGLIGRQGICTGRMSALSRSGRLCHPEGRSEGGAQRRDPADGEGYPGWCGRCWRRPRPPFVGRNRRKSWWWARLSLVLSPIFRSSELILEPFSSFENQQATAWYYLYVAT